MNPLSATLLVVCAATVRAETLVLATFDGKDGRSWEDTNDPVMGGQSSSSFHLVNNTGVFMGVNKIVPSLKAPGFCKVTGTAAKADLSSFAGADGATINLEVQSKTPTYQGFKIEFAGHGIPKTSIFGGGSFKAGFNLTNPTGVWQTVTVPLTHFSYDWSGFTGDCNTKDPSGCFGERCQHYCCDGPAPMKKEVCPQAKYLGEITSLGLWAEGVASDFDLEIRSISISKP